MVRGQPSRLGRDLIAWRRLMKSWCHRSTVSGRTSRRSRRSLSIGSRCSSAARNARSPGENCGRALPSWRSKAVIWCRNARISVSLSQSLMGSRRSKANALVTPRWASRSSTASHHAVLDDVTRMTTVARESFRHLGYVGLLAVWMRFSAGTTLLRHLNLPDGAACGDLARLTAVPPGQSCTTGGQFAYTDARRVRSHTSPLGTLHRGDHYPRGPDGSRSRKLRPRR